MKAIALIALALSGCVAVRVTNVEVRVDKDIDVVPIIRDVSIAAEITP